MSSKVTRKQIGLIHVAKSELLIQDDDYRALLGSFGVESSKDLTRTQFKELLQVFEKMGFQRKTKQPLTDRNTNKRKSTGSPRSLITGAQKNKILAMWDEISTAANKSAALNKFVKRITKIDHLDWIAVGDAQKVIVALERMKK